MKAFVLCKLVAGQEQSAMQKIRAIEGVGDVHVVFGGWDLILSAEADTMDKLSTLVISQIRTVPGVAASETLVTTSL